MRRLSLLSVLFASVLFAGPAAAADKKKSDDKKEEAADDDEIPMDKDLDVDEDDFKDAGDGKDEGPPPVRLEEDDKEDGEGEEDDIDFSDEDDDEDIKFTDEDEQQSVKPRGPGEDTAQIYRDTQKKCKDMTPDEEQLVWEEYLRKYPKTLFADRIDDRMEELSSVMFGERVPGSDKGERGVDAAQRELNWALPYGLSPIDPRSHVSVGVQWGFPSWFGGKVDAEYAFMRQASAHLLIGRDFAGGVVQPGAKYAIIKSSRTGTILTGGLDVKLNMSPTFVAFRPIVSFGQRLRVMDGLDISAQFAADVETRPDSDIRYTWGLHGELRPNKIVSLFWEWQWDAKYIGHPDVKDSFRFFTTTFGLKFNAQKAKNDQGAGRLDAGVGAALPYVGNYWGFYAGGVDLMGDYYF